MAAHDPNCAACPYGWTEKYCFEEGGRGPADCPTVGHRELARRALEKTTSPENLEFFRQATIQEGDGYINKGEGEGCRRPAKPRIQEIMEFAKRMGYRRICLAFCIGLVREGAAVKEIFEANGLETISVLCKVGRVPKESMGVPREHQINPSAQAESMCNPVLQAEFANECGAELNVLLGLCVGHDSLFFKHANAPCTVLAVKDRVLGHNPLAAVYQCDSYWRCLKSPDG